MGNFYLIGLIFMAIVSLIFSILGFAGKDIILDDAYIKASKEEREDMDKNAYRLQGAIVFLFIFAATLCNLLRALTHTPFFYLHCVWHRCYRYYLCHCFTLFD